MKRRNFFKKIAGTIAGIVIAPIVVKSQETAGYIHEAEWEYVAHWTEIHKRIVQDPNAGYIHDTNEVFHYQAYPIDYEIGDEIISNDYPPGRKGICTGFRHDNTCVDIDGECCGGKTYFRKALNKDHRMVLFTADGDAYESKDIILT